MEAWLEARGLSSKQLAARARAEDVHVPLASAEGRHVLRCVTCEALRAYRLLPSGMRVRVVDTSPVFVSGSSARESVYLEYEDANPLEATQWSALELSGARREDPATFMGVACGVVAALVRRRLLIESARLKESCIEVDRARPGAFRLIPLPDLRIETEAAKVEACARNVLYKYWEQAPNHVKLDPRAVRLAQDLMDRKRNSPVFNKSVESCIAAYIEATQGTWKISDFSEVDESLYAVPAPAAIVPAALPAEVAPAPVSRKGKRRKEDDESEGELLGTRKNGKSKGEASGKTKSPKKKAAKAEPPPPPPPPPPLLPPPSLTTVTSLKRLSGDGEEGEEGRLVEELVRAVLGERLAPGTWKDAAGRVAALRLAAQEATVLAQELQQLRDCVADVVQVLDDEARQEEFYDKMTTLEEMAKQEN